MIISHDAPLCLEKIVTAVKPRVCDAGDRRAVLRALEKFDALVEVRKRAKSIRTAIRADDELAEMGVEIPADLRRNALEQFDPPAVAALQDHLWTVGITRLAEEVGPLLAKANRRAADRLAKAADELHAAQEKVLEPFGIEAEVSSAEKELRAASAWFRAASERKLSLEGQSDPRRSLSESFAEPL